ncbi:something about silencing, SAS, complex subunit 4 domain-containing protein [Hirsutella rhossiliensis]|uniref:Something about silencing, SAS, complex subunit 4 domain-containing protein n=1 Tax=Hirsutella rhossiliensis TaxID=111463 RepID=A0A9P8N8Q0_9HYPO|nr:something about silencing, SAS, complex subunit 4 domain-containing protein [Hirsutella rhossiliensis]KAH0968587.1 something about silencing, SAS, complex subunit 4 domain-containing protein [Hirsutella rhossiliensis]
MASLTRSTRRAEGLHHHHHNAPRSGPAAAALYHDEGRQKRGLEAPERDLEALRSKKARIAVEILARTAPTDGPGGIRRPAPRQHPFVATSVGGSSSSSRPELLPASSAAPTAQAGAESDPNLTKHQAKAINGINHGLGQLLPEPAGTKKQGRTLRSQEATRFKSELSAYFPDYDEVIGNDPKEQYLFTLDTPIVIVDSDRRRVVPPELPRVAPDPHQPADFPVKGYGDSLYTDVFDSQRIDFGFLETQQNSKNLEDPLPDRLFEPVHKKAERLERSIRNSEKGRAQHEKDQIIRLLEGLQGHDWLRVMGVSGVTETKKKSFEPARAHFIKGCQSILDKFRNWSLEEKRRKQEKERAMAEQAAEDEKRDDGPGPKQDARQEARRSARRDMEEISTTSQDDASEASSPAQQLRQEAMARSQMAAGTGSKRPRAPARPTPPKAFKSFFSKKHERDGALNRNRRTGRKVLAWGHAVPEMAETDFVLPEEYRDDDTLKARARKKRRDKRGKRP